MNNTILAYSFNYHAAVFFRAIVMTNNAQNTSLNTIQFSCGHGLSASAVATMVDVTTSSESESVAAWKMAETWFSGQSKTSTIYVPLETSMIERWRKPGELETASGQSKNLNNLPYSE